jgi:hypothetical protein
MCGDTLREAGSRRLSSSVRSDMSIATTPTESVKLRQERHVRQPHAAPDGAYGVGRTFAIDMTLLTELAQA